MKIEQKDSVVSRMANYWNELTFWGKIFEGAAVSSVPLVAGVLTHNSFLLYMSGVTALGCIATAVLLDNYIYDNPPSPGDYKGRFFNPDSPRAADDSAGAELKPSM